MFYDCSFLSSGLGASIGRTCQLVGWLVGPRVFQFLKKFLILEKLHIFDNLLYFVMIKGVCHFKRISGNELARKNILGYHGLQTYGGQGMILILPNLPVSFPVNHMHILFRAWSTRDYTWVIWMDTFLFRIQNTEMFQILHYIGADLFFSSIRRQRKLIGVSNGSKKLQHCDSFCVHNW